MSMNELHALAQQFANAFDRRALKPAIELFAEDVEVLNTFRTDPKPEN